MGLLTKVIIVQRFPVFADGGHVGVNIPPLCTDGVPLWETCPAAPLRVCRGLLLCCSVSLRPLTAAQVNAPHSKDTVPYAAAVWMLTAHTASEPRSEIMTREWKPSEMIGGGEPIKKS